MLNYPNQVTAGDLTAAEVQTLLENPIQLAHRMDDILNKAFVSDLLLTGVADVTGTGSALIEEDAEIFPDRDPEEVNDHGEYPKTPISEGPGQLVKAVKRGQETDISDAAIARRPGSVLDKALAVLANGLIRSVDSLSLAAIASKVTQTHAASALWENGNGSKIVEDVLLAKAEIDENELGYSPNVAVLRPTDYARVSASLISANIMPREQSNPLLAGDGSFEYLGLIWTQTIHTVSENPLLVDATQLGGMLSEDLGGGYAAYGDRGIEVKTIRHDDNDSWTVRVRRVTNPYIVAPKAGIFITGTK